MKRALKRERTVIVIDDEEAMCEGCRQTLEEQGYQAGVATSGKRGLEMVEKMKPSVRSAPTMNMTT